MLENRKFVLITSCHSPEFYNSSPVSLFLCPITYRSLIGTLKSGQLDNGRGLSSDLKSRPDVRLQLHHICWVTMKIQSQSLPTARREERK